MIRWNPIQIKQHEAAAIKLGLIKEEFHSYILKNMRVEKQITEKDCVKFIGDAYNKHGLMNDHKKEFAIVAFGSNTKEVHYFPKDKGLNLEHRNLILLDIWARLNKKGAPYADATFMFFYLKMEGRKLKVERKIPIQIQKTWEVLARSRDNAINYIKRETKKGKFPRGLDIDRVAHDHIGNSGLGHGIKHTVGHSLGFDSPHGKLPGINWREYSPIQKNVGYTIEPGIYFDKVGLPHQKSQKTKDKNGTEKFKDLCWGMRTEIDFYINNENEVVITTPVQKEIEVSKVLRRFKKHRGFAAVLFVFNFLTT